MGREQPAQKGGVSSLPVANKGCLANKIFLINGDCTSTLKRGEIENLIRMHGGIVRGVLSKLISYVLVCQNENSEVTKEALNIDREIIRENDLLGLLQMNAVREEDLPWNPIRIPDVLWTTLFQPTRVSEILGNQKTVYAISRWLKEWTPKQTTRRAVLIFGSPGIGKTTAAKLIATEQGYTVIETNASETRSQSALEPYQERSMNSSMDGKTLLIMDEVDGMSSGDSGGVATLVKMIKKSKIPIICICNDRYKPALRTLATQCVCHKFEAPETDAIVKRLEEICESQKMEISPLTLRAIVESHNGDMRAILNFMHSQSLSSHAITMQSVRSETHDFFETNIFQITTNLFTSRPKGGFKAAEQLTSVDPQLLSLMVFENYLDYGGSMFEGVGYQRKSRKSEVDELSDIGSYLNNYTMPIEWISLADAYSPYGPRVQEYIQVPNFFDCCSMIAPTHLLIGSEFYSCKGSFNVNPSFPTLLGKGQTLKKNRRTIQTTYNASVNKTSCSEREFMGEYGMLLNSLISTKSVNEGLDFMKSYGLDCETLEELSDLVEIEGEKSKFSKLPSKHRASLKERTDKKNPLPSVENDDDEF